MLYNIVLASAIQQCESAIRIHILVWWMNLELVRKSELSQKEKNKYHILMHVYRIQKDDTNEPIFRAAIETQT